MKITTRFEFGDSVIIDGCDALVARVTGVMFKSSISQVEISWVHNGAINTQWVDDWRLSPAPK